MAGIVEKARDVIASATGVGGPALTKAQQGRLLIRGYPETFTNARGQGRARIRFGLDVAPMPRKVDFTNKRWAACFAPYDAARDTAVSYEIFRTATGGRVAEWRLPKPVPLPFEGMRTPDSNAPPYSGHLDVELGALEDGCHHLIVHAQNGTPSEPIHFLVRSDIDALGRRTTLVAYPTFTLQAYNFTGGMSFYVPKQRDMPGMRRISLQRPLGTGLSELHQVGVSAAVEQAVGACGVAYSVTDNQDLHLHQEILDGAELLIITGHAEYITHEIRTAIEAFIARGGNMLVLSGNTFDAQVNYVNGRLDYFDPVGKLIDKTPDPKKRTGRYISSNIRRVIDPLLGLTWRYGGFPPTRNFPVESAPQFGVDAKSFAASSGVWVGEPNHPIFAGLGLERGAIVGAEETVQDLEIDGVPVDRLGNVDHGTAGANFAHTRVLGGALVQQWSRPRPLQRRHARLRSIGTVVEHRMPGPDGAPQGGIVLNFGSPGWSRAAGGESVPARIVCNAIGYLARTAPIGAPSDMDNFEPLSNDYPAKWRDADGTAPAGTVMLTSVSRTGSMMVNALLDAHPGIAMCYDIVPKPLSGPLKEVVNALAEGIRETGPEACQDVNDIAAFDALRALLKDRPFGDGLNYLLGACRRSSIPPSHVLSALKALARGKPITHGADAPRRHPREIKTPADRLLVAKYLLAMKLRLRRRGAEGGRAPVMSGMKTTLTVEQLLKEFPDGRIVLVVRDPRDVAVSQLKRQMAENVRDVATRWTKLYGDARATIEAHPDRVLALRYEDVVGEPGKTLPRLCAFLGLERIALHEVLRQNAEVFSVKDAFDSGTQQWWTSDLTRDRLAGWRKALSSAQVKRIDEICGGAMAYYGYRQFGG